MIKLLVIIVAVALLILAGLLHWGNQNWSRQNTALFSPLASASLPEIEYFNKDELSSLPAPVKKYFNHVLSDNVAIIRRATIGQLGGFRAKPDMQHWSEMQARQLFLTEPRTFCWCARVFIFGDLSINVCDSFIDARGGMQVQLQSLLTMLDAESNPQLDEAALQRYLAEAVWFPTALLPGQGVRWRGIDLHRAKASMVAGKVSASLQFIFNDKGEISGIYSPGRYREVSGDYRATPWQGRFSNYSLVNGYRIPMQAEVEWLLDSGAYTYWRATLTDIHYE